ncbi:MAG: hypothetical protein GF313_13835 [Caldithrix sp.]|nr:hypothetical protein [Caldithrix sp.]
MQCQINNIYFRRLFVLLIVLMSWPYAAYTNQPDADQQNDVQNFYPTSDNEPHQINGIVQDNRGMMYFGNEKGVLEFDATYWKRISLPGHSGVFSLAKNDSNRIFVGGNGEFGYLGVGQRGRMQYVSLSDSLPEDAYLKKDPIFKTIAYDGGVAFLTDNSIYQINNGTAKMISTDDHFYGAIAFNGRLYVIDGQRGLTVLKDNRLVPIAGGKYIRSFVLLPYRHNKILIVGDRGHLQLFDVDRFEKRNGKSDQYFKSIVSGDDAFNGYQAICGTAINKSYYALGTTRGGCFVINTKGERLYHFSESNGLPSNDIFDVYCDADNQLWMATAQGVSMIDLPDLIDDLQIDEEKQPIAFRASIRSYQSTQNDSIIFGGAFYRRRMGIPILKQLEHLYHVFSYNYNSFRFSYSANDYQYAQNLEFQTYMEGLDQDWSPWSERTFSEFRGLYWGKYRFHVRARNPEGEISKQTVYEFKIKPPWFESWWFYLGQVVFIFFLLILAWSFKKMKKSSKMSEKLTNIAVIVIFKYVYIAIAPVIGIFSAGIAFFKILTSVVLGFVIDPTKAFINNKLNDLIVKDGQHETGEMGAQDDAVEQFADMTDDMQSP